MPLYTSCFELATSHPRVVSGELRLFSIALKNPDGWDIDAWAPSLRPLDHLERFWSNNELTQYGYDRVMREQVLRNVHPAFILDRYDNGVLVCREPPTHFCHRHVVRRWVYENTGVVIEELDHPEILWPEEWSALCCERRLVFDKSIDDAPTTLRAAAVSVPEAIPVQCEQISLF